MKYEYFSRAVMYGITFFVFSFLGSKFPFIFQIGKYWLLEISISFQYTIVYMYVI